MPHTKRISLLSLLVGLAGLIGGQLAAIGTSPAGAEVLTLDIDPLASRIEFGFGATFQSVVGSLQLQGGSIRFDTASGAASGEAAAAAGTARTGVKRRDRKMHEKILESALYPTIVFSVERIDGTLNRAGRSELQLHGTLKLHGVSRPAAMPAVAVVNGDQVKATGYLTIDYLSYGMRDPSFLLLRVEKKVKVKLTIAGHLAPAASAALARPANSPPPHP
ncbi:MAG TPA: YceI family protein [Thermoanaerobaculia bacterium]|nr:YceI family protein [Thermoanaerobaculia bacterium]